MSLSDLQKDPAKFRAALNIDTDGGPKPFQDVMDDWQDRDFRALDSGWMRSVIGTKAEAKYQRAWLERARGHSKSGDIAVMAAWALFASRRRLSGIAAAGDQDQARLLRNAISRLVYCNPWLADLLEIQAYRVVNKHTKSELEIITSDAPSSYGLTPDFVICDEVVHWQKQDLWDSLVSSAAKRSTCMFVVITNAGIMDDWQWKVREAIREDPNWHFSRLEGPVASWISPELLEEQQRVLVSEIAYRRLWVNEWTSGGGDALTREDIDAAFNEDLQAQRWPVAGFEYTAGFDLGVTRDASAIVVLGVKRGSDDHGQIRLAATRKWLPTAKKKVDLNEVERELLSLHDTFKFKQVNYDPWEARQMASRLQSIGFGKMAGGAFKGKRRTLLPLVEVSPSGKNLQAIATTVIESFNDRRVELFPDKDLRHDLLRLRVEERSYGFRLTSPRDETGHGDVASAFGLALLAAIEIAGKRKRRVGMASGSRSSWEDRLRQYRSEQELLTSDNRDGREELRAMLKQMSNHRR